MKKWLLCFVMSFGAVYSMDMDDDFIHIARPKGTVTFHNEGFKTVSLAFDVDTLKPNETVVTFDEDIRHRGVTLIESPYKHTNLDYIFRQKGYHTYIFNNPHVWTIKKAAEKNTIKNKSDAPIALAGQRLNILPGYSSTPVDYKTNERIEWLGNSYMPNGRLDLKITAALCASKKENPALEVYFTPTSFVTGNPSIIENKSK